MKDAQKCCQNLIIKNLHGNKKMFVIFARSLGDFQIIQESWHK